MFDRVLHGRRSAKVNANEKVMFNDQKYKSFFLHVFMTVFFWTSDVAWVNVILILVVLIMLTWMYMLRLVLVGMWMWCEC